MHHGLVTILDFDVNKNVTCLTCQPPTGSPANESGEPARRCRRPDLGRCLRLVKFRWWRRRRGALPARVPAWRQHGQEGRRHGRRPGRRHWSWCLRKQDRRRRSQGRRGLRHAQWRQRQIHRRRHCHEPGNGAVGGSEVRDAGPRGRRDRRFVTDLRCSALPDGPQGSRDRRRRRRTGVDQVDEHVLRLRRVEHHQGHRHHGQVLQDAGRNDGRCGRLQHFAAVLGGGKGID